MLAYYFRAPKPAARLVWPSTEGGRASWFGQVANMLNCFLFPHPRIRFDRIIIPLYGNAAGAPGTLKFGLYDPVDGSQIHYEAIAHGLTPGKYEMYETILPQGPVEYPPGQLAIMTKHDTAFAHAYSASADGVIDVLRDVWRNFDWSAVTLQVAVDSAGKEAAGWFAGRRADGDFVMPSTLPDWDAFTAIRGAEWLVYFVDGPAWETVRDLT